MQTKINTLHWTAGFRLALAGMMILSFFNVQPARAAAGLPDLIITNVTITDLSDNPITQINRGEAFKVNITVTNQGGDDYEDCVGQPTGCAVDEIYRDVYLGAAPLDGASCHYPGSVYNDTETTLIPSTQSSTRSVEVTINTNGTFDLYAYVDVNCSTDETNNDNNGYDPITIQVGTQVDVTIGGTSRGDYYLNSGQSVKLYYNLDTGPVKVESSGKPIIAALRDSILKNGSLSTFSQLMGLPQSQLSTIYVFPHYVNNTTLNEQLRVGNVGDAPTTVTVTIGGVVRGQYDLDPNTSVKLYYNLDTGPVKVESSGEPIIAALRDSILENGSLSTFSQLMGLPQSQLSTIYVFPHYVNNTTLNEQLRVGNVGDAPTTVTVTIGGVVRGQYDLDPNTSVKLYYNLDTGPVKVESSGEPIIAALRDSILKNGSLSTFSQLMGLPQSQLSTIYVFPHYVNNTTLNEQLRVGNVGDAPTTVTVTIGGVVRGQYDLDPNTSVKLYYNLDTGPVKVESSGEPIIAALRDSILENGSLSTFSQLMGLPQSQLSTIYVFPHYVNNTTLNEQLRVGVP